MAYKYWIKLYHEMLDDPRMGRLSDTIYRRAVECFLLAGDRNLGGELPTVADMSWRLRVPQDELAEQLEALELMGILQRKADGEWLVAGFKKRQQASPGAERMQRLREARRRECAAAREGSDDMSPFRHADTDTETEPDAEDEREADADAPISHVDPEDERVKVFLDHTQIPLNTGGMQKWEQALARMIEAGVEAQDVEDALTECRRKGLIIATLASVVNPAIIAMSRRSGLREAQTDDYRRYLKGEYGDVGNW